jgi:hypothetical protein
MPVNIAKPADQATGMCGDDHVTTNLPPLKYAAFSENIG